MMKTTIFVLASLLSSFALATETETFSETREEWVCWATGRYPSTLPGNEFYQSVNGRGPTESDAFSDAMNACYGMGLQFCMVQQCYSYQAE